MKKITAADVTEEIEARFCQNLYNDTFGFIEEHNYDAVIVAAHNAVLPPDRDDPITSDRLTALGYLPGKVANFGYYLGEKCRVFKMAEGQWMFKYAGGLVCTTFSATVVTIGDVRAWHKAVGEELK